MTLLQEIRFLEFLASIAALIWLTRLWRGFVVDATRQVLFELRDGIFDLAVQGRIEFSDPVYRALRERINRSIRFCEHYSVTMFALFAATSRDTGDGLRTEIEGLPDKELANRLLKDYQTALRVVLVSMVFRSFLSTLLFVLAIPVFVLGAITDGLRGVAKTERGLAKIERQVERDVSMAPAHQC